MKTWGDLVAAFGVGAFVALGVGMGFGLVASVAIVFMAGWGIMNSRWARALLHRHIQHGIGEHWSGMGLAHLGALWLP